MKKVIGVYFIASIIAIGRVTMAADEPKAPTAEKQKTQITEKQKTEVTTEMAAALKQFSSEVQAILTKENIHSMLDRPRLLKEAGVTYQPELIAADDLASKLSGCNLGIYAGIKMYDAIYAAVFTKKQEVSKSLQAVDAAMQKLDLRSHADFSGNMRKTVRRVACESENIDIKEMLNQLTTDTINELPVFVSSRESSHFLADSLCGFMIEVCYVMGYFHQTDPNDNLMKLRMQQPTFMAWMHSVNCVLDAFEKARKDLQVECKLVKFQDVMKDIVKLAEAEHSGKITTKEGRAQLAIIRERVTKIRASVLANAN